jgi:hypothetical protein
MLLERTRKDKCGLNRHHASQRAGSCSRRERVRADHWCRKYRYVYTTYGSLNSVSTSDAMNGS